MGKLEDNVKLKKDTLISLYRETKCNSKQTYELAGVSKATFFKYKKEDPEFKEALDIIESSMDKIVIQAFWKKIEDGEWRAIERYLNRNRFKDTIYGNPINEDNKDSEPKTYVFSVNKMGNQAKD